MGLSFFEDSLARRLGVKQGALVRDVVEGTGADAAGIQPTFIDENSDIQLGDVLIEVAGRKIRAATDVARALDGHKPGEQISVIVERDGRQISMKVELVAAPQK